MFFSFESILCEIEDAVNLNLFWYMYLLYIFINEDKEGCCWFLNC